MTDNCFNLFLEWSYKCTPAAIELLYPILQKHLRRIIQINQAPIDIDRSQATDLLLFQGNCGNIAFRIRDNSIKYRDLTLQTMQGSGRRDNTEYVKIMDKNTVKWYLYCWGPKNGDQINEWMFLDIEKIRNKQEWDVIEEKYNPYTQEYFKPMDFKLLSKKRAIIEYNILKYNNLKTHSLGIPRPKGLNSFFKMPKSF